MAQQFACPSCGAPLDYDGSGSASMRCPFCNTAVVVPEELRSSRPGGAPRPNTNPVVFPAAAVDVQGLVGLAHRMREVRRLVRQGQTAEAANLLHELTGLGQEEAAQAIAAMADGQLFQMTASSADPASSTANAHAALDHVNQLMHAGNEAKAARVFDAAFHVGPEQALQAVRAIHAAQQADGRIAPAASAFPAGTSYPAAQRAQPQRARTSRGSSCIGSLVTLVIVLAIVVGVGAGIGVPLLVSGGPLADLWSRFNPLGFARVTLSFGDKGIGNGYFSDPREIAVDSAAGRIYVGDYQDGRVQAFDFSGKYINQWSLGKSKASVRALAVDRKGVVYAVGSDGNINRYAGANGGVLGAVAYQSQTPFFESLAVGADGSLVGLVDSETVVRFNSAGKIDLTIPQAVSSVSGDSELDAHVAVDGQGQIYVLGSFNNAVFIYSPDGKYLSRFGSEGSDAGQFDAVTAIAVDNQGRIYVSDFKGIQVFDPTGRYLNLIDVSGAVFGMAFDDQNNLYVVTNTPRVIKLAIVK